MALRRIYNAVRALAALVALSTIGAASYAQAPPDEASLLRAWEAAQRLSPATQTLEPTGERRYRYRTSRFPFDGELVVLNALIEPMPVDDGTGYFGTVEVELVGLPPEVPVRFAQSYARWQGSHVLFYDPARGEWLTGEVWRAARMKDLGATMGVGGGLLGFLSANLFWVLFLVLLVVFLSFAGRKANRQMKTALEAQKAVMDDHQRSLEMGRRSIELNEEANRLLAEIRDELRGRPRT
ncbi:MAG TPA: hypothetical protein VI669_09505 [Vicinamibacteria bacterium]